jgi:hypothetical protein
MPQDDKLKLLYDDVSKDYEVGSIEEFKTYLSDDKKRAAFFEEIIKPNYDVADISEFESIYDLKKKEPTPSFAGAKTLGQALPEISGGAKTATPSPLKPSVTISKSGVGKTTKPDLFKGTGALPSEKDSYTQNLQQKVEIEDKLLNDPTYTLLTGTEANQEKRAKVFEEKNKAIAKERGYKSVDDLYKDMDEMLATSFLDERAVSEYQGLRNLSQIQKQIARAKASGQPTENLEKAYQEGLTQYSQAKAQLIATANENLKSLRLSLESATPDQKQEILDQIKLVEASRENFFKDKKVAAKQIVLQEGLAGENISDQEKVRRYAHSLMRERSDLMDALGLKGSVGNEMTLDKIKELGYNTFIDNPYYDRLVEVEAKLKAVAPIALLNESPITETEGAATVFGKTFMKNLVPKAGVSQTQLEKGNAVLEGLKIAGVDTENVMQNSLETLSKISEPYEDWSAKDWATMTGATAAFLPKFAIATMLTEGLGGMAAISPYWRSVKILSERGSLGAAAGESTLLRSLQSNSYGRGLLQTAFKGAEFGAQSQVESALFQADRDEVNALTGFVGGAIGKQAEFGLGLLGKTISSFFSSKAPAATNKMIEFAKLAGGKVKGMNTLAIGETGEELGEELGGIWLESENGQDFINKVTEQFGDVSKATKFFLSSYMMGLAFGAGSELGKFSFNKADKQYKDLSPADKAVADQVVSDLKQEQNKAETQAGVTEIEESQLPDNDKREAIKEVTKQGELIDDVITGEKTVEELTEEQKELIAELEKLKVPIDEKAQTEEAPTTILDNETAQITGAGDVGTPAATETADINPPTVESAVANESGVTATPVLPESQSNKETPVNTENVVKKEEVSGFQSNETPALKDVESTAKADYLVDSIFIEKINPDGENTPLTERQQGSIDKAIQMAIDAGQTAEQIAGTLNGLGYAFRNPLGMQAAQQTLINYIKNRIKGTDTRNVNEFAKDTKAVESLLSKEQTPDKEETPALKDVESTAKVQKIKNYGDIELDDTYSEVDLTDKQKKVLKESGVTPIKQKEIPSIFYRGVRRNEKIKGIDDVVSSIKNYVDFVKGNAPKTTQDIKEDEGYKIFANIFNNWFGVTMFTGQNPDVYGYGGGNISYLIKEDNSIGQEINSLIKKSVINVSKENYKTYNPETTISALTEGAKTRIEDLNRSLELDKKYLNLLETPKEQGGYGLQKNTDAYNNQKAAIEKSIKTSNEQIQAAKQLLIKIKELTPEMLEEYVFKKPDGGFGVKMKSKQNPVIITAQDAKKIANKYNTSIDNLVENSESMKSLGIDGIMYVSDTNAVAWLDPKEALEIVEIIDFLGENEKVLAKDAIVFVNESINKGEITNEQAKQFIDNASSEQIEKDDAIIIAIENQAKNARTKAEIEELVKAVESLLPKEQTPTALKDVESTAKALDIAESEDIEKLATIIGLDYKAPLNPIPNKKDFKIGQKVYLPKITEKLNGETEIGYEQAIVDDFGDKTIGVKFNNGSAQFSREVFANKEEAIKYAKKRSEEIKRNQNAKLPSTFETIDLISESYHKAKKDGSNPELVKAVEELLGAPATENLATQEKGETPDENENQRKRKRESQVLKPTSEAGGEGVVTTPRETPPAKPKLSESAKADITEAEKEISSLDKKLKKGEITKKLHKQLVNIQREAIRKAKGLPPRKYNVQNLVKGVRFANKMQAIQRTDWYETIPLEKRIAMESFGLLDPNTKDIKDNIREAELKLLIQAGLFAKEGGLPIDQYVADETSGVDLDPQSVFNAILEEYSLVDPQNIDAYFSAIEETYDVNEQVRRYNEEAEIAQKEAEKLEAEQRQLAVDEADISFELIEEYVAGLTEEQVAELEAVMAADNQELSNQIINEYEQSTQQDIGTPDTEAAQGETGIMDEESQNERNRQEFEQQKARLQERVDEAQKAVNVAEADLKKAKQSYEKALAESQIDLTGRAKADELLFKTNLPALNKKVKEKQDALDTTKADLEKAKTDLDNLVPPNQGQLFGEDKILSALDKLKFDTDNTLNAFGLIPAAWNATIDIVKAAYSTSKNIAEAIEKGLEYARKWAKDNNAKFDEVGAKAALEKVFKVEPKKEAPKAETPKAEKPATKGERAFTKQFIKEYPRLAPMISEKGLLYDKAPNKISIAEAQGIIDYLGVEEATRQFKDFGSGMTAGVRMVVGQLLIKKLEADGNYESAIDLLEELTQRATEYGQEIQALSLFSALSPEGQLRMAQKEVNKAKEKRAKADKPKTDKLKKELKKVNKEAVDEVLQKPDIAKKVGKSETIQQKPDTKSPEYGSKNKLVTKDRYKELSKKIRGSMFAAATPEMIELAVYHIEAGSRSFADFSKAIIEEFGSKSKPYLKSMYEGAKDFMKKGGVSTADMTSSKEVDTAIAEEKGKEIVKRIEKAIINGNKKAMDKAIAELQKIAMDAGLWGKYKKYAVSRLKNIAIQATQLQNDINGNPALQEFVDGLVKNISQKVNEAAPDQEKTPKTPKKSIEIIADAFKNIDKYKEVWEQTKAEFEKKYADKPEVLAMMDAYFGDILDTPFSKGMVKSAVREGLKEMGVSVSDIIKEHYTVYDYTSRSLAQKLIQEAGLEGSEAQQLAEAVQQEFDRIATEKKRKTLDKILSKKARKNPEVKSLESEIIRLTNLGAFSDEQIMKEWADKMGYPKLTPENIKEIQRLANRVQETEEGFKKFRAIEDLLSYQANIKGVSSVDVGIAVWYANVLSGYKTQMVNMVANIQNSLLLYGNAVAQNPTDMGFIAQGFIEGFKRGILEAGETLRTGYSPIRGKVEVPNVLERVKFTGLKSPLNYAKYVSRVMKAADVLLFEANKEMRAYQLAVKEAAKKDMLEPNQSQKDKAIELIGKTDAMLMEAQEQAQLEYEQELQDIESQNLTPDAKKKAIKQAEKDRARRVFEIMEENRSQDIQAESADYAANATYNYKPYGILGMLSTIANYGKDALARNAENADTKVGKAAAYTAKIFANALVPFTNIIANVANEALNYTLVGAGRAARGKQALTGYSAKTLTDQQKVDLYTKAAIGTAAMTALYLLSQPQGDDDEEAQDMYGLPYLELTLEQQKKVKEKTRPILEITANGYGDYRKNYKLMQLGWQPYSIRVGDTWVSYQYSPLLFALGFVGNVRDYESYRKEKLSDDGLATKTAVAFGYTVKSIMDATFVSNLSAFLNAATSPQNEDRVKDFSQATGRTAASVAVPNLYIQTAKAVESAFNIPSKEVRGEMFGNVLQHIPVVRNMYYDKLNALGEPIPPDTDKFVSFSKSNKIFELLVEKNVDINPPSINSMQATVIEPGTEQERFMTPEEYYTYVKTRGEYITSLMESQLPNDSGKKMTIMDYVAGMTKAEAQNYFENVKKAANEAGKSAVIYGK